MDENRDLTDLERAVKHCTAGLKAVEAARDRVQHDEGVYPTHLHLAAVELATAIEVAMKVAMRNG
jgi:hypothetical protein